MGKKLRKHLLLSHDFGVDHLEFFTTAQLLVCDLAKSGRKLIKWNFRLLWNKKKTPSLINMPTTGRLFLISLEKLKKRAIFKEKE